MGTSNVISFGMTKQNLEVQKAHVKSTLETHSDIDGVLAAGSISCHPILDYRKESGGSFKLGCFDFSEKMKTGLEETALLFGIDQQQYLQGYVPVALLAIQATTKNALAKNVQNGIQEWIKTGPGFIDSVSSAERLSCISKGVTYCDDPEESESYQNSNSASKGSGSWPRPTSTDCPCISKEGKKIVLIHHGGKTDSFWWVVENAAAQAGRDMFGWDRGTSVEILTPDEFDLTEMKRITNEVIARDPPIDGLILSLPSEDFKPIVAKAAAKNINVVSINSGDTSFGSNMHVGQNEYVAGYQGAEKISQIAILAGKTPNFLCADHEAGFNEGVALRCDGLRDYLIDSGVNHTGASGHGDELWPTTFTDKGNINQAQKDVTDSVAAYDVSTGSQVNGILAMGTQSLRATNRATAALPERVFGMGSFDTGPEQQKRLIDGSIAFAVDQQQWLQGWLPVMVLSQNAFAGMMLQNENMLTGPAFLTKDLLPYKSCENMQREVSGKMTFVGWKVCPPPQTEEKNRLDSGLVLLGNLVAIVNIAIAVVAMVWTIVRRKEKIVRYAQPVFLAMVAFGCIVSSSSIFFLSVEDADGEDAATAQESATSACMAVPWFYSMGFVLSFAPPLCKNVEVLASILFIIEAYQSYCVSTSSDDPTSCHT